MFGFDMAVGVGLFAGATTNTPALGAAQEVLRQLPAHGDSGRLALPGLAYAVAYPFGVIGIIIAMNVARRWLRINVADDLHAHEEALRAGRVSLQRLNVEVINPNFEGLRLSELPALKGTGIVISRILKSDSKEVRAVHSDEAVHVGDKLLVVGPPAELRKFRLASGQESKDDLMQVAGPVDFRRAVLTQKEIVGQTLRGLAWNHRHGVTVTRLTRADIEMPIDADLDLRYGDVLQIVGTREGLDAAVQELGNSPKDLNHTQQLPMFLGIAVGVIVGATPFYLPGVPAAIKLGLAGGPLLAGLLFSRLGRLGPLLWHAPTNVTMLLREFGIALFLACVGLVAGEHFMGAVFSGQGLLWLGCGAVITLVPLALATWVGRHWFKLNYVTLCGLLSGSMTDPPALAFANQAVNSDAPNVAYAAVYPLTMILRIIAAQTIVLLFLR
jgi:putative transport protein